MTSTVSFVESDHSPIARQSQQYQDKDQVINISSSATAAPMLSPSVLVNEQQQQQQQVSSGSRMNTTTTTLISQEHLRPIPKFLQSLYRAATPKEKENIIFKFAATLDYIFYDIPPTHPSSREGNALERDVQALLEACFSILQVSITDETYVVEPPARFAALRALGAFVQGSSPIPTILSEDWKQPHVPLYLAVMKLLTVLFEKGSTQYVFAIRCLSVLAIQALQIISPQNPVDCAVSSILSSPSRTLNGNQNNGQQSSTKGSNNANNNKSVDDSALITHSSPSNLLASDAIMNASTASPSKRSNINNNGPTTGSPLRIVPQLHPNNANNNNDEDNINGDTHHQAESPNETVHRMIYNSNNSASHIHQHDNSNSFVNFETLYMDHLLQDPILRPLVLELWKCWDASGIDVRVFTACPESIHVYLPTRLLSSVGCVYRDFITCPERPKMEKPWSGNCEVHLKTNIAVHSNVMYRILIEGYNYGVNSPIQSELVGAAKRHWDTPGGGEEEQLARMCRDYANGCSSTQYFSTDGYLVIKLVSKSFFGVGFTASAWMIFHGHQPGFPIEGEIFHQEEDL